MNVQQARRLQRAVTLQAEARDRLRHARADDVAVTAAKAYIAATDAAYDAAVAVSETARKANS